MFYLLVGSRGHVHLPLVVEDLLLVRGIDGGRRWAVELGTVLLAESSVLSLFSVDDLFASSEHFHVELTDLISTLYSLREICCGSLLLELLDLRPDGVRDVVVGGERVESLGETVLLEEASQLLVTLRHL